MVARLAVVGTLIVDAGHRGVRVSGAAAVAGGVVSAVGDIISSIALYGAARGAAAVITRFAAVGAFIVDTGRDGMLITGAAYVAGAVIAAFGRVVVGITLYAAACGAAGVVARFAGKLALPVDAALQGIGIAGAASHTARIVAALGDAVAGITLYAAACGAAGVVTRFAGKLALAIDAAHQGIGIAGAAGAAARIVAAVLDVVIGSAGDGAARCPTGVVTGLAAIGALVVEAGRRGMLITGAAGGAA